MIVIHFNTNFGFSCFNNVFSIKNNGCVESIEFIDNEIDETIIKYNRNDCTVFYDLEEKLHNPVGPAYLFYYPNGALKKREYWIRDVMHRENGPANESFFDNGQLHWQQYFDNGERHRLDGPAYERFLNDGTLFCQEYYIDDERLDNKYEFLKKANDYHKH